MSTQAIHTFLIRAVALTLLLAVSLWYMLPLQIAMAASITSASDTMSSATINAASSHALRFITPTGASDNTDTIVITFPATFNFTSKTIGTVSFTHGASTGLENTETLAASPSATSWGAVFSGTQNRVLTLTAPTDGVGAASVAPGDKMIITYNSTNSLNPGSAASYGIDIAGAFGDTGTITVNILTSDQVALTATVAQSLTFSISSNSISFGTLNSAAARFASSTGAGNATEVQAHNIIIGTNAANGYSMTVNGSTLTSGANTITPIGASNVASSIGTEQFGLRMTATGGNGAVVVPYAASGFALDTGSFPDVVATSTSASANTTYSARYIANITSNTEAGAYTGTLTYVATANY